MGGRPRTPTSILEARGSFRHNPARGRARENEPRPGDPLGDPPEDWVERAKHSQKYVELVKCWSEIATQAAFGVLTSADRSHVEMTCRLMYKIRFEKTTAGDYAQLNKCLGQMGLNPSDRSRVNAGKKTAETASEWAKLAGERSGARAN
jgi:hypothetical protein